MERYFSAIAACPLFAGIEKTQFADMLRCVQGRVAGYQKNQVVLLAGDPVETVGLVLAGQVQVVRDDMDGKQSLRAMLCEGELFGEVFACAGIAHSPVTVVAAEDAVVLYINYRKVVNPTATPCIFHQRLVENMLTLMAQKTLMLSQKLELISKRTTRERVLHLLQRYSCGVGQPFVIPYSRETMAAYLCVERSALSATLSNMEKNGLIRYTRNQFTLL